MRGVVLVLNTWVHRYDTHLILGFCEVCLSRFMNCHFAFSCKFGLLCKPYCRLSLFGLIVKRSYHVTIC